MARRGFAPLARGSLALVLALLLVSAAGTALAASRSAISSLSGGDQGRAASRSSASSALSFLQVLARTRRAGEPDSDPDPHHQKPAAPAAPAESSAAEAPDATGGGAHQLNTDEQTKLQRELAERTRGATLPAGACCDKPDETDKFEMGPVDELDMFRQTGENWAVYTHKKLSANWARIQAEEAERKRREAEYQAAVEHEREYMSGIYMGEPTQQELAMQRVVAEKQQAQQEHEAAKIATTTKTGQKKTYETVLAANSTHWRNPAPSHQRNESKATNTTMQNDKWDPKAPLTQAITAGKPDEVDPETGKFLVPPPAEQQRKAQEGLAKTLETNDEWVRKDGTVVVHLTKNSTIGTDGKPFTEDELRQRAQAANATKNATASATAANATKNATAANATKNATAAQTTAAAPAAQAAQTPAQANATSSNSTASSNSSQPQQQQQQQPQQQLATKLRLLKASAAPGAAAAATTGGGGDAPSNHVTPLKGNAGEQQAEKSEKKEKKDLSIPSSMTEGGFIKPEFRGQAADVAEKRDKAEEVEQRKEAGLEVSLSDEGLARAERSAGAKWSTVTDATDEMKQGGVRAPSSGDDNGPDDSYKVRDAEDETGTSDLPSGKNPHTTGRDPNPSDREPASHKADGSRDAPSEARFLERLPANHGQGDDSEADERADRELVFRQQFERVPDEDADEDSAEESEATEVQGSEDSEAMMEAAAEEGDAEDSEHTSFDQPEDSEESEGGESSESSEGSEESRSNNSEESSSNDSSEESVQEADKKLTELQDSLLNQIQGIQIPSVADPAELGLDKKAAAAEKEAKEARFREVRLLPGHDDADDDHALPARFADSQAEIDRLLRETNNSELLGGGADRRDEADDEDQERPVPVLAESKHQPLYSFEALQPL